MAEDSGRLVRFTPGGRLSLTPRILIINLLPLLLLGGGVFYLDSYRKQLLDERYKLARVEAQITAEAPGPEVASTRNATSPVPPATSKRA